jgi:hypothetical protein
VDPVNNSRVCAGRAACHGAELVFDNASSYNSSFTPDEQSLTAALLAIIPQFLWGIRFLGSASTFNL